MKTTPFLFTYCLLLTGLYLMSFKGSLPKSLEANPLASFESCQKYCLDKEDEIDNSYCKCNEDAKSDFLIRFEMCQRLVSQQRPFCFTEATRKFDISTKSCKSRRTDAITEIRFNREKCLDDLEISLNSIKNLILTMEKTTNNLHVNQVSNSKND